MSNNEYSKEKSLSEWLPVGFHFRNSLTAYNNKPFRFTYMYYNMFVMLKTEVMVVETLVNANSNSASSLTTVRSVAQSYLAHV